ncbi:Imm50 family immunity protein [Pseudomonas sp. SDO524_S393]
MKYWNDLDETIFFNKLFSTPIEIGKIYIHSLEIKNDQSSLSIGFDIPDFPDFLPEKWENKGYNTCRIGLTCHEINSLQIINLPRREVFTAKIMQENGHYLFSATSKNASIEFKVKWLSMDGPSVYINCPEPDDHDWSDRPSCG